MLKHLRMAGEKLRDLDDKYSNKIAEMYEGANPAVQAGAYLIGGAHPSFRKAEPDYRDGASKLEQAIGNASVYAIPAMNAVPKYVLPTVGVGLAAKGLFDVGRAAGEALSQQTDGAVTPM